MLKPFFCDTQGWEDEDESQEDVNDEDEDEEDEDEEGEGDADDDMPGLETLDGVDPATFTYQDGIPSDPILPLALVNRSFLNAVRSLLYGRQIYISDMYQASLLLRTLSNPTVSSNDEEPEADDEETRARQSLTWLVRHVSFDLRKTISLGRGGGQVILDILKLCPRVEQFQSAITWTQTSLIPLRNSLQACDQMKTISLCSGNASRKEIVWTMEMLSPLLSTWKCLEGKLSCML
jgi:hypothetical protein